MILITPPYLKYRIKDIILQSQNSYLKYISLTIYCYSDYEKEIVFFVASRGHHADVGGKAPGSMPPDSKSLEEEGDSIIAMKIVEHNEFKEEDMRFLLRHSRAIEDNMSDLKA